MLLIQPRLTSSLFYSVAQVGSTPSPPGPTPQDVGLRERSTMPTLLAYFPSSLPQLRGSYCFLFQFGFYDP